MTTERRRIRAICTHQARQQVVKRTPDPERIEWRCPDCGLRWCEEADPKCDLRTGRHTGTCALCIGEVRPDGG